MTPPIDLSATRLQLAQAAADQVLHATEALLASALAACEGAAVEVVCAAASPTLPRPALAMVEARRRLLLQAWPATSEAARSLASQAVQLGRAPAEVRELRAALGLFHHSLGMVDQAWQRLARQPTPEGLLALQATLLSAGAALGRMRACGQGLTRTRVATAA